MENNPTNWIDPTGLYGFAYNSEGCVIGAWKDAAGLRTFLESADVRDKSVAELRLFGHANEDVISFRGGFDQTAKGGVIKASGSDVRLVNKGYQDQGEPITKLLQAKLAPGARIVLGGCNTAGDLKNAKTHDNNLAKRISTILKGHPVVGSFGETFPELNDRTNSQPKSRWRTYINGAEDPNQSFQGWMKAEDPLPKKR